MNEPFKKSQQKNNLKLFCKGSKQIKSTGKKKKAKKSKVNIHRLKAKENRSKKEKKHENKNLDSEQKENRPLQVSSMDEGRINRFYKTQRKILLEEGIIEDLQSNYYSIYYLDSCKKYFSSNRETSHEKLEKQRKKNIPKMAKL